MALATVADLANYMDITLSNRQEVAAQMVLDGLQAEIETVLRRPIEVTTYTDEEHYVEATYTGLTNDSFFDVLPAVFKNPYMLSLNNTPVVEVTNVQVTRIDSTTPEVLTKGKHYVVKKWGLVIWGVFANELIEVTYSGGLDGASIPFLKLLLLRAASREIENRVDDTVGIKDLTPRHVAPLEIGLTQAEREALRNSQYRRRRI